jgi:hypothetical protein
MLKYNTCLQGVNLALGRWAPPPGPSYNLLRMKKGREKREMTKKKTRETKKNMGE